MAKIYLRSIKDPLYIDDARGEELSKKLENGTLDAIMRIGSATVRREDIKVIILDSETKNNDKNTVPCGVKDCAGGCHWTITRDDGRSIWKQSYQTRAQAQAELSFENLSGYHLEHHFK